MSLPPLAWLLVAALPESVVANGAEAVSVSVPAAVLAVPNADHRAAPGEVSEAEALPSAYTPPVPEKRLLVGREAWLEVKHSPDPTLTQDHGLPQILFDTTAR